LGVRKSITSVSLTFTVTEFEKIPYDGTKLKIEFILFPPYLIRGQEFHYNCQFDIYYHWIRDNPIWPLKTKNWIQSGNL